MATPRPFGQLVQWLRYPPTQTRRPLHLRKPRVQIPGSAPGPLRSAAIESRDPAAHWDAQKRPDTSDNGSREGRQDLSMSNDARLRLDAQRVSRIVLFAIFAFKCARRYYSVSWWPDQNGARPRRPV